MDQDGIVAIGLLTRRDLNLLGPTFDRLWPVEDFTEKEVPFAELLQAIDEAQTELNRAHSRADEAQLQVHDRNENTRPEG